MTIEIREEPPPITYIQFGLGYWSIGINPTIIQKLQRKWGSGILQNIKEQLKGLNIEMHGWGIDSTKKPTNYQINTIEEYIKTLLNL